jgi:type IX secretion system PorP/SprF family membrane protein
MVRILYISFAMLFCSTASAQQVATYAQYMFNGLAINPAYAGSQDALTATVLTRFQNLGLPGAPNTQTLAIHSPLVNKRVGVGLLVIHDKLSVIEQTGVHGSYSYRIRVSKKAKLSMGIQAGMSFYRAGYSSLDIFNANDPAFASDIRETRPNVGGGLYYYTKLGYVGLSVPHLINNAFDRDEQFKTVYQNKPIILNGGYVFTIHRMLKFKPNALLKILDASLVEFDINANFLMDEVAWLGLSYKSSRAFVLLSQIQVTDQLQLGYSHQIATGQIRKVEVGSHEFMLNYRFVFHKKGLISPRYF